MKPGTSQASPDTKHGYSPLPSMVLNNLHLGYSERPQKEPDEPS